MDLSGWVGVGLGGNCDCRCGILYAPMLEGGRVVFVGLVNLTSLFLRKFLFSAGGWSASRVLLACA